MCGVRVISHARQYIDLLYLYLG